MRRVMRHACRRSPFRRSAGRCYPALATWSADANQLLATLTDFMLFIRSFDAPERIVSATSISATQPSRPDDERLARRAGGGRAAPAAIPAGFVRHARPRHADAWRSHPISWRFELFLASCSAWAAAQLWFWPHRFPLDNTPTVLGAGMDGHARSWALVCGAAALLKVGGLACRLWTRWTSLSAGLMISGLFMSIVIWTIVGTTWSLAFPRSLTPI